jgi:hypothetical protein
MDSNKHSGEEFREKHVDPNKSGKFTMYIKQAAKAPYHNIYGQSADARFTDKGFESTGDNYTYNNVWEGQKVIDQIPDGEGTYSLYEAIKSGKDSYDNGSSLKAAMETAASLRGVNTKRHKDVTLIPKKRLNKWAKEYLD